MKRPRIRLDGRPGAVRWTGWDGKPRFMTSRLVYVFWRGIVTHAAMGDPGPFEIRKLGGPWHLVDISQAEALELLRQDRDGQARYQQVLAIIERRKVASV